MAWVKIDNLAQHGIVKDVPPHELPVNAWTDGKGIIFTDGAVRKFEGWSEIYATSPRPPYLLLPGKFSNGNDFWMIPESSDGSAWYLDGIYNGSHTDISPVTISATITLNGSLDNVWTGCVFNSQPVIGNGTDQLLNWTSPTGRATFMSNAVSFTCASIRSFKNFLVAVNITKGASNFPQMVKWSHSASSGSNPSWDETDPTLDAGEYTLSETPDVCVDSMTLRDTHIIYKERSIWGMQFIGHPFIFRFFQISASQGVLGRNCVAEIDGRHAVLTSDDIILHDGQIVESICEKRIRNDIFSEINSTYGKRSFVAPYYKDHQLWICYPVSSPFPDTAWVWDWRSNTWTKRDLGTFAHATTGGFQGVSGGTTWAADADLWSAASGPWDTGPMPSSSLFMASQPLSTKIQQLNFTNLADGSTYLSFVERVSMDLGDDSIRKIVKKAKLHILGTAGGQISVQVGSHNVPDQSPVYSAAVTHTIGTTFELDTFAEGRYIAIKISSQSDITWRLHAYELDVEMRGRY